VNTLSVLFIALGLSMDCFAVAIASGFAIRNLRIRHAFILASAFGGAQAVMPTLGWLAGRTLLEVIAPVDHWVAFGLLGFIGAKMIYESFKIRAMEEGRDPLKPSILLVLAVATSIDALAVGLSLSILHTPILGPVLYIGVVAFGLSFVGVYIGNYMGKAFESKLEALGGAILIGIGLRILIQHLTGQA
jgi:putative Mn2+ efflux pump MntP